jgi:hypothetical protein
MTQSFYFQRVMMNDMRCINNSLSGIWKKINGVLSNDTQI